MKLIEIVKSAQTAALSDEDGYRVELELLPGLKAEEIEQFARSLPCPVSDELRELLAYCRGFAGAGVDVVDFTGRGFSWESRDIFPHAVPVASDGAGNFWVVDLTPESTAFGPVYFVCHDPPVILY